MNSPSLLDKWQFLGRLMEDPKLTDLARRLAYLLLELHGSARGGAWPSLDTIQAWTSASRQGCLNAIRLLEDRGWFVKRTGGGRTTNVYVPQWDRAGNVSAVGDEVAPLQSTPVDHKQDVAVNPSGPQTDPVAVNCTRPLEAVVVNQSRPQQSSGVDPSSQLLNAVAVNPSGPESSYIPLKEDPDSPTLFPGDGNVVVLPKVKAPAKPAKPAFPEEAFAEFWTVYPRKTDQDATRGAYREALKRGATPAGLIVSASSYAAVVAQDDTPTKFIKKPANFLRSGAWRDAPDQSDGRLSSQRRQSIHEAADLVFGDSPEARRFREAL